MDKRLRIEDACRDTLARAYDMMVTYKWSQYKAYSYAEDLLEGIYLGLRTLYLYNELNIVLYYKDIAWNKMHKDL